MSGYWAANWQIWVSAFCVISIYTYLFKDNALYRVMMQVFIGLNLGYQAIIQWRDVLYPQWWLPMVDGFKALFGGPGSPWGALWALVGVIGLLFYLQLSRRYASLSKIAIGITIGIGAGLTFKSQLGQNIPQLVDSFKPLAPTVSRPLPRLLLGLPGTGYRAAVDGSLGIFVLGRSVRATELLGGQELWSVDLPEATTGSPSVDGDVIVVPCGRYAYRLDRSTGALLGPASPPAGENSLADAAFMQDGDRIAAMVGSRRLWLSADAGRLAGSDSGKVFAESGSDLLVLDSVDGRTLARCRLPGRLTAPPAVAVYRQPQYANGVVLAPVKDEVVAFAIREGIAEGIHAGDEIWSGAATGVVGIGSFDGVALVSASGGSALWEIPPPPAHLSGGDYFDNWVTVITIVSVMTYFFFSFKRRGPATVAASTVGRWMLMIGFGAFFGNTVMTRMSFLLDRLMFLIDDWLRPFFHHLFG